MSVLNLCALFWLLFFSPPPPSPFLPSLRNRKHPVKILLHSISNTFPDFLFRAKSDQASFHLLISITNDLYVSKLSDQFSVLISLEI